MFNVWFAVAFIFLAIFEFAGNEKYPTWLRIPLMLFFTLAALMNIRWALMYYHDRGQIECVYLCTMLIS